MLPRCLSVVFLSFTNNNKPTWNKAWRDADAQIRKSAPAAGASRKKVFLTGCWKTSIQLVTSSAADVLAVSIWCLITESQTLSVGQFSSLREAGSFWGSHVTLQPHSPSWESIANPGQTAGLRDYNGKRWNGSRLLNADSWGRGLCAVLHALLILSLSEQPRRLRSTPGLDNAWNRAGGGRLDHRSAYITTRQLHIHLFLFLL